MVLDAHDIAGLDAQREIVQRDALRLRRQAGANGANCSSREQHGRKHEQQKTPALTSRSPTDQLVQVHLASFGLFMAWDEHGHDVRWRPLNIGPLQHDVAPGG
jgi:hypothetical protein